MLSRDNGGLCDTMDDNCIVPPVEECDCFFVSLTDGPVMYCMLDLKDE